MGHPIQSAFSHAAFLLALVFADYTLGAESAPAPKAKGPGLVWTIGFYAGSSPFDLKPAPGAVNPVITAADARDPEIDTVAHPFLAIEGSRYHAFFTAKNAKSGKGGVGLAESSDGLKWTFRGLVLRTPHVLSYPFVFKSQGTYYMLPESSDNVLRLYRAVRFPDQWEFEGEILKGEKLLDPTLVQHNGHWWLFVGISNSMLRLFHSDSMKGPFKEHPRSPVVENDANMARPSGRPFLLDGKLYRLAQDCEPTYGNRVVALEITRLTPTEYRETLVDKSLVSATSSGWNSTAMHHVDAHRVSADQWVAMVDARGSPVSSAARTITAAPENRVPAR